MDDLKSENMQFRMNTYLHIGANYSSLALIILPVGAVIFWKMRQKKKNNEMLENKFSNFELKHVKNNKNGTI